ncbi:hypothetical protein CJU89_4889 [Yarrowia sp. B02]|nr:hypothetical protein CJU89_4889 [Yarrowia sp. B02]
MPDANFQSTAGAEASRGEQEYLRVKWPWFNKFLCENEEQNNLIMAIPYSTVSAIVRFLQGQEGVLKVEDAARLMYCGHFLGLEELRNMSVAFLKSATLDFDTYPLVWEMASKAGNSEIEAIAIACFQQQGV